MDGQPELLAEVVELISGLGARALRLDRVAALRYASFGGYSG